MQILLGRSDFFVARIQNAGMVELEVDINELFRRIQQPINDEQNLFCPRQTHEAVAIISQLQQILIDFHNSVLDDFEENP